MKDSVILTISRYFGPKGRPLSIGEIVSEQDKKFWRRNRSVRVEIIVTLMGRRSVAFERFKKDGKVIYHGWSEQPVTSLIAMPKGFPGHMRVSLTMAREALRDPHLTYEETCDRLRQMRWIVKGVPPKEREKRAIAVAINQNDTAGSSH